MAIEIKRPTSYTNDSGSATLSNPGNAYDGNSSTYAQILTAEAAYSISRIHTWQSSTKTYTSLNLNVSASGDADYSDGAETLLHYSTNGGSSWTLIRNPSSAWAATDTISLNASQDLSQLQIKLTVIADSYYYIDAFIRVYEAWTEGIYTYPPFVRTVMVF